MTHLLVEAAFQRPVERPAVWFMRQAGRYLQEYRDVRDKSGGFLDMCYNSDLAAEVSLQPFDLIGFDAVIMFSDILTALVPMGMKIRFEPGPIVDNPLKTDSDIDKLTQPDYPRDFRYIEETLHKIRKYLDNRVPTLGFGGAPFTLASYIVGNHRTDAADLKTLMYQNPDSYHKLMRKLTDMTVGYLNFQIACGAQGIQMFDSWVGSLAEKDFREYVLPYVQEIYSKLEQRDVVPTVYFINGGNHLLKAMTESGADVTGLDWRTSLENGIDTVAGKTAIQGNLDPFHLFLDDEQLVKEVQSMLESSRKAKGYIFNLGHGINRFTNPDKARLVVETVKNFRY